MEKTITIPDKPIAKGKLSGFFVGGLIPDGYGVKGFEAHDTAIATRKRQEEAFEAGIAPACGDEVFKLMTESGPHPEYTHGYVTKQAEPLDVPHSWRGWKDRDLKRFIGLYPELYAKSKAIHQKATTDFRWANLGTIDGKVVFLDWS